MASAEELKEKGNAAFGRGEWQESIELYTKGLEIDPRNKFLYSNRSAAFLKVGGSKSKALHDAEKCVELDPKWAKSYSRLGAAQWALGRLDAAISTYREGLKLDPDGAALKEGLRGAMEAKKADEEKEKLLPVSIKSLSEFRGYINQDILSIVDFSATWCGPCKQVSPLYDALAKRYPRARFYKAIESDCQELIMEESISAFPTFRLYSAGKQLAEIRGANIAGVEQAIQKHLQ